MNLLPAETVCGTASFFEGGARICTTRVFFEKSKQLADAMNALPTSRVAGKVEDWEGNGFNTSRQTHLHPNPPRRRLQAAPAPQAQRMLWEAPATCTSPAALEGEGAVIPAPHTDSHTFTARSPTGPTSKRLNLVVKDAWRLFLFSQTTRRRSQLGNHPPVAILQRFLRRQP